MSLVDQADGSLMIQSYLQKYAKSGVQTQFDLCTLLYYIDVVSAFTQRVSYIIQSIWLSGSVSASGPAGCGFKSQSVPKVIRTLTDHTVPSDQDFK